MRRNVCLALLLVFAIVLSGGTGWSALAAEPQDEKAVAEGKVNINTASRVELMKLKGIGPVTADKIIEYRNAHGPFAKPEDIQKIRGIGKRFWEKNREAITVK